MILPNDQYLFLVLKQQFSQTSANLRYSGHCKSFGHIRFVGSQRCCGSIPTWVLSQFTLFSCLHFRVLKNKSQECSGLFTCSGQKLLAHNIPDLSLTKVMFKTHSTFQSLLYYANKKAKLQEMIGTFLIRMLFKPQPQLQ